MNFRKRSFVVLMTIVTGSIGLGPAPALADDGEAIHGWSKPRFIAAAIAEGATIEAAQAAWGNEDLMRRMPVSSSLEEAPGIELTPGTSRAPVNFWSTWCEKADKNFLGNVLIQYRLTKSWTSSFGSVYDVKVVTNIAQGSWGYYYNGVVVDESYNYESVYNIPDSGHTTNRVVKFSIDVPAPYTVNASMKIDVNENGGARCTTGGGL